MKPDERDAELIGYILEDIDTLQKRVKHFKVTEESFCIDRTFEGELAFDAVMNPLYRIAEDTIHLSENVEKGCPDIPWRNIRGFRNFVAYGYHEIDRAIAWKVIVDDISKLADSLKNYLVGLSNAESCKN